MPLAFFKVTEETVRETLRQGLFGWEVTDCVITLTHTGYLGNVNGQVACWGVRKRWRSTVTRPARRG
jgi:hypothetical protein